MQQLRSSNTDVSLGSHCTSLTALLLLQRRLEARGVELQADMHSVRHRIDDPAGWEAFSLYSQQQADLEGRLRLVGLCGTSGMSSSCDPCGRNLRVDGRCVTLTGCLCEWQGKRQEDLLQSCMKQLQDLQAFVYERRPDPQDVVLLQVYNFRHQRVGSYPLHSVLTASFLNTPFPT